MNPFDAPAEYRLDPDTETIMRNITFTIMLILGLAGLL